MHIWCCVWTFRASQMRWKYFQFIRHIFVVAVNWLLNYGVTTERPLLNYGTKKSKLNEFTNLAVFNAMLLLQLHTYIPTYILTYWWEYRKVAGWCLTHFVVCAYIYVLYILQFHSYICMCLRLYVCVYVCGAESVFDSIRMLYSLFSSSNRTYVSFNCLQAAIFKIFGCLIHFVFCSIHVDGHYSKRI